MMTRRCARHVPNDGWEVEVRVHTLRATQGVENVLFLGHPIVSDAGRLHRDPYARGDVR
jgi:hypothetical protein